MHAITNTQNVNVRSAVYPGTARRLLGVALLLLLTVACSSNDIKDEDFFKPADLQKFTKQMDFSENWSTKVGGGQGKSYVRLAPFYRSGTIYAASHDGIVLSVDADSGKKNWQAKTELSISGGVAVDRGLLFVGTLSGDAVALSPEDGSEVWRTSLSSEVLGAPRSNGTTVVVHCYDGRVYGLNHETGAQVWEYESQNPKLTLRGSSSPLILEELAIVGLAGGKLVALDAETGILRWEQRVAIAQGRSEIERMVDIEAAPISDGPLLFTVSYQGRVVVLEAESGRILWRKEASSYVGLGSGFGNLYVAEADGKLSAYKVNDGTLQWQMEDLSWRKLSSPATLGAYTVVADYDGYIHAVSQIDGQLAGRTRIDGSGVRAPLIAYDSKLLIYSNNGKLASYSVKE
ncbi:MAG: outer membrane protein assembly factor BamB [Pseudomonadales bacterium]